EMFFFSSRRRHTRSYGDWSSDVCSSDLLADRLVHMVDGRIVSDIVLNDQLRICEFLKGVEAFKNLTPHELTDVAERMTRRQFMRSEERRVGKECRFWMCGWW